jgi:hypothetical protein
VTGVQTCALPILFLSFPEGLADDVVDDENLDS